jgi:hypothetical protein
MDVAATSRDESQRKKRTPILIENVYEKETTDSFIERNFSGGKLHRCRSVAEFNVDAVFDQYGGDLVRSAQELQLNPDGNGFRPQWTLLVFQRPGNVFWHFLIKSNGYSGKDPEKEYTLVVTAGYPEKAAEDALMLQKHFTANEDAPGFFMVRDLKKPRRIPLKPEYALSSAMLDLHYGDGIVEWTDRFAKGLVQNGLSILRGKPGTGKTSFLRHLIYTHAETHRFYYLPVDSFGLLQGRMPEFLERERKRLPDAVLVLVLEDAEQLLLNRQGFKDGFTSSLLNFTDGFIGDLIQAHLICTINSDIKDLDEAVLRPGRQRFFREFELLDWRRASTLAEQLGVKLGEERAYSLAEVYHFRDISNTDRLQKPMRGSIGFNPA